MIDALAASYIAEIRALAQKARRSLGQRFRWIENERRRMYGL